MEDSEEQLFTFLEDESIIIISTSETIIQNSPIIVVQEAAFEEQETEIYGIREVETSDYHGTEISTYHEVDSSDTLEAETSGNQEVDSSDNQEADTSGNQEADTSENQEADTSGNQEADSSGNQEADSSGIQETDTCENQEAKDQFTQPPDQVTAQTDGSDENKATGDQGTQAAGDHETQVAGESGVQAAADKDIGAQDADKDTENLEGRMMVQTLDDPPYELENQFILRVPLEYACAVKEIAHSRNVSTKNKLRIDLTPGRNYAAVEVEDVSLTARLVNLPCIIGSLKTLDRKTFYKTADISQMLVCTGHIDTRSSSEKSTSSDDLKTIMRNERVKSKRSAWKHGIAPPLKNVRKKRFRKIRKKDLDLKEIEEMSFTEFIDCPDVENEVKRLLSSDAEAIKARWKVIGEDKTIEIESQGFIRGFGIAQEKCGHKKERILSESDILREMFNDSNSGSDEDMEIEDEEDYDDCYSYVEEEEEEYDEDEDDEDDDCEDLERDLQAKINEFKRCGAKEGSSSMVVQIQKQIHYLESKLQEIQNKEQRQNHLIMKVESLVLKTHLQSVLKQLQWEEEQKAEQFQWSCTLGYRSVAGNFLQFQEPQTTEWPDISSTTILTDSTPTAALEYQLITSHLQGAFSLGDNIFYNEQECPDLPSEPQPE